MHPIDLDPGHTSPPRSLSDREYWRRASSPDRKNRHCSPWLVIRGSSGDLGARPLPAGKVFWASPDIWVDSGDALGNPIAGRPTHVVARIRNLGMLPAARVQVDFFWGDPSIGLGPGNMTAIGTESVEIRRGGIKMVRCEAPWTPKLVNNGHECLIVNCSNYVLDPIRQPFQPVLDRHVGQRNVHVVEGKAGTTIPFMLWINNPFSLTLETRLTAWVEQIAVRAASLLEQEERAILQRLASRDISSTSEKDLEEVPSLPRIHSRLGGISQYAPTRSGHSFLGQRLIAADALTRGEGPLPPEALLLHVLNLRPFEQRPLELELGIPADARPGEYSIFHVMQHMSQLAVGGYTIIVKTAAPR
jgi:hypothetical protein